MDEGLFRHTDAILFFGTPFRGTHHWYHQLLPDHAEQVTAYVERDMFNILGYGGHVLQELRHHFKTKLRQYQRPNIGCFWEAEYSNVGKIIGDEKPSMVSILYYHWPHKANLINRIQVMLVDRGSAELLEGSPPPTWRLQFLSRSLQRHHFNLHNFGKDDRAFEPVRYVISKFFPYQDILTDIQDGKLDRASATLAQTEQRAPLHVAAMRGDAEIVQKLLESYNCDPNCRDIHGQTPLHLAVKYERPSVARVLCSFGADQNIGDRNNRHPIVYVHSDCELDWIFRVGHKLEEKDENSETALLYFSKRNRPHVVASLLQQGADTQAIDLGGRTALAAVCKLGHKRIARLLIKNGAGLEVESYSDKTPLYYAASWGHVSIVRTLVQYKAQIEHTSGNHGTALRAASIYDQIEVVELLLSIGANAQCQDATGKTPLIYAAEYGHSFILELLLDEGNADIDAHDKEGLTALCVASREGHEDIVQELVARGASLQPQTPQMRTPIDEAEAMGRYDILDFLTKISESDRQIQLRQYASPRRKRYSRVVRFVKKKHPERYIVPAIVLALQLKH